MTGKKRLSPNDPHSFSNPENCRVDHMKIVWEVDFSRRIIEGSITYRLLPVTLPVKEIVLDTRALTIKSVSNEGCQPLRYKIGEDLLNFGKPLTVDIDGLFDSTGGPIEIKVEYETTPESSALQWLEPEQTAGKSHPYLFSQCQAIHARSLLPCQDTPYVKCPYSAEVTVPKSLQALMSAEVSKDVIESGEKKTNKFEQKVPIQSYLIALAVGHIKSKRIGPRSTVWAEPEILEASAYEFAETEEMLQAAEKLMGEYVWGVYDILVLPPSFPFGGMENPNLTFATPTLLAGDRSLADVSKSYGYNVLFNQGNHIINVQKDLLDLLYKRFLFLVAHEISHSWTGNLVTNVNFEHFWLNEGFTVFAERKITGMLKGEPFRQFSFIGGWKSLTDTINALKSDNPVTKLVPDLTGLDPDEHFSLVPYEKGSVFLFYLESKVGGAAVFEPFFKHYIQANRFRSIDTDVFKNMFMEYFTNLGMSVLINDIDWDAWLFSTGMPIIKPNFDTSLTDVCVKLVRKWFQWDVKDACPFSKDDIKGLLSDQVVEFLAEVLDQNKILELPKVQAMQSAYDFNSSRNSEIRFRWLRICLQAKWKDQLPLALKFVTEQGRMKYVRPIYREMYNWEEIRPIAVEHFKKTRSSMMQMSQIIIAKELHL